MQSTYHRSLREQEVSQESTLAGGFRATRLAHDPAPAGRTTECFGILTPNKAIPHGHDPRRVEFNDMRSGSARHGITMRDCLGNAGSLVDPNADCTLKAGQRTVTFKPKWNNQFLGNGQPIPAKATRAELARKVSEIYRFALQNYGCEGVTFDRLVLLSISNPAVTYFEAQIQVLEREPSLGECDRAPDARNVNLYTPSFMIESSRPPHYA